ncbi:MAG: hypothetical protein ACI8XB_001384 [Patiriisocius sp.]|jgi:hypothetical protein
MKKLILISIVFTQQILMGQYLVPYRVGDSWGYSNKDLQIIIDAIYEEVGEFRGRDVTWAKKDNQFGFINKKNEVVVPFEFDEVSYYKYGHSKVKQGEENFYIDQEGNRWEPKWRGVCGGSYSSTRHFMTFIDGNKTGFYFINKVKDINGEKSFKRDTIAEMFIELIENGSGVALVKKDMLWGVVNSHGKWKQDYKFEEVRLKPERSEGRNYIITRVGSLYGLLGESGETIAEVKYHKVEFCPSGKIAKVWANEDLWYYIDEEGNEYYHK